MLPKSQDRQAKPSWLGYLAAPLISALLAGVASGFMSYVGVQKDISAMNTTVNRVSLAVDKMAEKQSDFFEKNFFPLVIEVKQHGIAINTLSNSVDNIREDIKALHPQQRIYSDGRRHR